MLGYRAEEEDLVLMRHLTLSRIEGARDLYNPLAGDLRLMRTLTTGDARGTSATVQLLFPPPVSAAGGKRKSAMFL